MNQDLEHLRLLSIFHYVVAGLTALFSLIPCFHLFFGLAMVTGNLGHGDDTFARGMGWFFIIFAGLFITGGMTFAVCLALAGQKLARQEGYTFCLVVAGVACMLMPFGTVLGVFTIVVLMRESVKKLFDPTAATG